MKINILLVFIPLLIIAGCGKVDNNTKIDNNENRVIVGSGNVSEKGEGKIGDTGTIEVKDGFSN